MLCKQRGFTLLEVLLAMSLLSIMMVLLFASLSTSARSWNLGEQKIAQVNEKAVTYGFLKRYLGNARPLWGRDDGQRVFMFQGQRQAVKFVSDMPLSSAYKGLQQFELYLDKYNGSQRLMVSVNPFSFQENSETEAQPQILLVQITSFKMHYFDAEVQEWAQQWQDKETLPALVKVSIELADGSPWPPMIFALKRAGMQNDNRMPNLGL